VIFEELFLLTPASPIFRGRTVRLRFGWTWLYKYCLALACEYT